MADVGWFRECLTAGGDAEAIVWRDEAYSYAWLGGRVDFLRRRMEEYGVRPGDTVAIVGDFSPVSCALLVALTLNRNTVVPLVSYAAAEQAEFLDVAEVQHVVEVDPDDQIRYRPHRAAADHPLLVGLREKGSPGLVLFSSGSTGKNKAALHDLSLLLEKFTVRRKTLRTITFLMFDHIGGVNTLFYILSNNGTVVTLETRDPESVCRAIERHRVELLPTSPSFLNLLILSEAYRRHDLSSLEMVTYGTEVMPESTLERLGEILPDVRLMQTYGLSEVGILRAKSRDDGSLWVRVGGEGYETRIVDGVLHIRARSAMLGYLNAPSPFDEEGWLDTGDVVEVDGEWLRFLGRESEIINVGGQKVYPAEVEGVLLTMPEIADVTVFGEDNAILGHVVVARVQPEPGVDRKTLKRELKAYCRPRLAPFKIPQRIVFSDETQHTYRYKKVRRPTE